MMQQFHKRVNVRGRENWKKLATLHGFLLQAASTVTDSLNKDETAYEDRIADTVEALNGQTAHHDMRFYTPEAPRSALTLSRSALI